jgi:hypothetical protein
MRIRARRVRDIVTHVVPPQRDVVPEGREDRDQADSDNRE